MPCASVASRVDGVCVTSLVVDAVDATVALAPRDLSAALDDEVGARGALARRADALVDAIDATRSREDAIAASEAAQIREKDHPAPSLVETKRVDGVGRCRGPRAAESGR